MSRLSVDGAELVCEERGVGRPLVLVHGTGFRTEMWGSVLEELSARHRVIAYDRRGYGRSVHRPVRDYRRHVSDAIAVIERLAAAPAVVVGHSSGASIALALAARRPDLVRALIVAEPPFHGLRHATGGLLAVIARAKLIQWLGRPERAAVLAFRWLSSYRTGGNGFDRLTAQDRALLLGNRRSVLAELDPHPTGVLSNTCRCVRWLAYELRSPFCSRISAKHGFTAATPPWSGQYRPSTLNRSREQGTTCQATLQRNSSLRLSAAPREPRKPCWRHQTPVRVSIPTPVGAGPADRHLMRVT